MKKSAAAAIKFKKHIDFVLEDVTIRFNATSDRDFPIQALIIQEGNCIDKCFFPKGVQPSERIAEKLYKKHFRPELFGEEPLKNIPLWEVVA